MAHNPVGGFQRVQEAQGSGGDNLRQYAKQTAAEVEARRRLLEKEHQLRCKLYEPLLRSATPDALAADGKRAAHDREAFKARAKAAKTALLNAVPASIPTHPGLQDAHPPYDDTWIDPNSTTGGGVEIPNKQAGWISISLSAGSHQYGGAGLLLKIFPTPAGDTLIVSPAMVYKGSYSAKSYFFGSASLTVNSVVWGFSFDAQGNYLPALDQFQSLQILQASASGLEQKATGKVDTSWGPAMKLQGGASYQLWMILNGDANSGGPGQGDWSISVTVPTVSILQF
jgi:hypothetical protein